ncbi:hypothetical protein HYPSUDRAFT_211865 [Hypholoma sublateritium FD-334 SS-4]|uniref:Uncharacterized protein n=1 Tax=Hypholoma sublateritium (strain FD-334 SS-4) TaxID=945553 RepID=A0A0D2LL20_HYPSF|nr:hypothetical protein HYPSUDRAFT_211865 [Hypholoma sublateritium FD-334 SS-4]
MPTLPPTPQPRKAPYPGVDVFFAVVVPARQHVYTRETAPTKEIQLSIDSRDRAADEIAGVFMHEAVHYSQHDARDVPRAVHRGWGVAEPALIADRAGGGGDAVHEIAAYFLRWLDDTRGTGTVWRTERTHLRGRHKRKVKEQERVRAAPLAKWPMPVLAMRIDDLDHAGVDVFLDAVEARPARGGPRELHASHWRSEH